MANNKDLSKANKAKKDEFYTQLVDIEKELRHYPTGCLPHSQVRHQQSIHHELIAKSPSRKVRSPAEKSPTQKVRAQPKKFEAKSRSYL